MEKDEGEFWFKLFIVLFLLVGITRETGFITALVLVGILIEVYNNKKPQT